MIRPDAATVRSSLALSVLKVLLVALLGTLVARLAWVQFVDAPRYAQAAQRNESRDIVVPAARGAILDRAGRPLVASRESLSVAVDREALAAQDDSGDVVIARLAEVLNQDPAAIRERLLDCGAPGAPAPPRCWSGSPYEPAVVAADVATDQGLAIIERPERFPGVRVDASPVRSYPAPAGANLAAVLGYTGPPTEQDLQTDGVWPNVPVGRTGLEAQYDDALRGEATIRRVEVTRSGSRRSSEVASTGHPGDYLVTSIDAGLQAVVERQLQQAVARARAEGYAGDSGAAVVLDVRNGEVLAMASYPTYDPDLWVGGVTASEYARLTAADAGSPLVNKVVAGLWAPASAFKPFSVAAAVADGHGLRGTYPCPSSITVGGQRFQNFRGTAYPPMDFATALEVSCDTVFYALAGQSWLADGGLDPRPGQAKETFVRTAEKFGLGSRTGVDLPGESPGRISDREDRIAEYAERSAAYCARAEKGYPEVKNRTRAALLKAYAEDYCRTGGRYRAGDALNVSVGQGDTAVTPIQMAVAYAAIANGGTRWRPQVAKGTISADGVTTRRFDPVADGTVDVPSNVLDYLRSALTRAPRSGTSAAAFAGFPLDQIPVAGKTGTGEVAGRADTAWFASFAPADDPKYAVVLLVGQGGTGGSTAAPSVRAIYEALFGVRGSTVDPRRSVLGTHGASGDLPVPQAARSAEVTAR